MIICSVRKNETLYEINISGHSGYDTIGKDIVCSSVSSSLIVTVSLLEKLGSKFEFKSDENIPMMNVKIKNYTEIDEKVLDNLIDCLKSVSSQYKKYLKINL